MELASYPKLGYDLWWTLSSAPAGELVQSSLFRNPEKAQIHAFRLQLLKWVGNKQRFAHEIASHFPSRFRVYYEPFLGSGAVLGTLQPQQAIGSDSFGPLVEIWQTLRSSPDTLVDWYALRWSRMEADGKKLVYEQVRQSYNASPNSADLLFLSRSCYGGVVRFRKGDGHMSTPCGAHTPISPDSFARRVRVWHERTSGADFMQLDFREAMVMARSGDLVYCDPPYTDSQSILYGAQAFSFSTLMEAIFSCKSRGVFIALSIDGSKRSGRHQVELPLPEGLFEREILVNVGRSMLKRFQMSGQTLENEEVADRLLLTY